MRLRENFFPDSAASGTEMRLTCCEVLFDPPSGVVKLCDLARHLDTQDRPETRGKSDETEDHGRSLDSPLRAYSPEETANLVVSLQLY